MSTRHRSLCAFWRLRLPPSMIAPSPQASVQFDPWISITVRAVEPPFHVTELLAAPLAPRPDSGGAPRPRPGPPRGARPRRSPLAPRQASGGAAPTSRGPTGCAYISARSCSGFFGDVHKITKTRECHRETLFQVGFVAEVCQFAFFDSVTGLRFFRFTRFFDRDLLFSSHAVRAQERYRAFFGAFVRVGDFDKDSTFFWLKQKF